VPASLPRLAFALGAVLALGLGPWAPAALAQRTGYIDSEYVLQNLPEYATVQQQLDRLEDEWTSEVETKREAVDELRREFQARELLYTDEERQAQREAIEEAERELQQLRDRYFGPDGALYSRQAELLRPIQERILAAVEEVATTEGYDYVFDKSGDYLFLFARDQYDLSADVLRELGVDVDAGAQR
jgi:outer membrane protein